MAQGIDSGKEYMGNTREENAKEDKKKSKHMNESDFRYYLVFVMRFASYSVFLVS